MPASGHPPEDRVFRRQIEGVFRVRPPIAAEKGWARPDPVAAGKYEAGETVGQSRLADAFGPGDQPSVGQAAAAEGIRKDVFGLLMAQKFGVFPGLQWIIGGYDGHSRATPRRL